MRKKWTERSLKQKWVAERLFGHAGSLAGIVTRLTQIAHAKSTLSAETDRLMLAIDLVRSINVQSNEEESWKQFQERNG